MKYRKEIDGLRALAVLPVIFFHAGFKFFSGGFIGVDIFFVISGYLITSILIEDIENKQFSFINFYERRARRIIPALFLVAIFCIPFAWIWMLPNQIKDFSQSLLAISFFVSNIFFWRESGYFSTDAEKMPLLHTWSLSVEEQIYLIFPIFLFFSWRFGKNRVFWSILFISACSLILSEWGWRFKPIANFYLTPTRAWEFFIGSIAAFIIQRKGVQKNNTLSLLGLVAILFSIFVYDETTPFPSIYSLVPVLGVLMIVLYAGKDTFVEKILSYKLLVGIGLISYSAYLWHQPFFAFARIISSDHPSELLMFIITISSIKFAFISWKYVEKPFRDSKIIKLRTIISYSILLMFIFVLFGIFGILSDGFKSRYKQEDLKFLNQIFDGNEAYVTKRFNERLSSKWQNNSIKIFLVGDSYAQDLTNAIYETQLGNNISLSTWYINSKCGNLYLPFEKRKKFINKLNTSMCISDDHYENKEFKFKISTADEIWLASSWGDWQAEFISESLVNLASLTNAKIRIFGRKDFPKVRPRNYLGLSINERASLSEPVEEKYINLNKRFKEVLNESNFIDVQSIMCGGSSINCKIFDEKGLIKTFDGGHLTQSGAKFYGKKLIKILEDDNYE